MRILWLIKLSIEAYPRPAFSINLLTDRGANQFYWRPKRIGAEEHRPCEDIFFFHLMVI